MAIPQQKFREVVLLMLYARDVGQASVEELSTLLMKELSVSRKVVREADERVAMILDNLDAIDEMIGEASEAYDFSRIHSVERNVLRLGVFELIYDEAIPSKVAIAEAIRLSKKFGSPESLTFVNAIMDNIYQSRNE